MKIYSFRNDLTGSVYHELLDIMLAEQQSFMLVVREHLALDPSATQILRSLKRFSEKKIRGSQWPGTKLLDKGDMAQMHFFRCDPKARAILCEPGALFGWVSPRYPEDLTFFDAQGRCVLATVSHEKGGWILQKSLASKIGKIAVLKPENATESELALLQCFDDS